MDLSSLPAYNDSEYEHVTVTSKDTDSEETGLVGDGSMFSTDKV